MKLGVIGSPIEHSKSPEIHTNFANQFDLDLVFDKYLVNKDECLEWIKSFFESGGLGLSVTLPLKEVVLEIADDISLRAKQAAAANMLFLNNGKIYADCTDGLGLVTDLKTKEIDISDQKILILGAGGAAKGIVPSLLKENPKQVIVANRTLEKAVQLVAQIQELGGSQMKSSILMPSSLTLDNLENTSFDLVINATSASTSPDQNLEVDPSIFKGTAAALDLYYSQADTSFMKMAKEQSVAKVYDGWGMLVEQAAESFSQWTGFKPDTKGLLESRGA